MTDEERKALARSFRTCFGNEAGARVLDYLSKVCFERNLTYAQGDPYHTAFNEGARMVMLDIRHWMQHGLEPESRPRNAKEESSA